MKKVFVSISMMICFLVSQSQTPQALNYQAVARTSNGVLIPVQNIGVRFSVLDVSINGTVLYSETHQTITNSYGLFTLAIGRGTPVTGTFAGINWASGTDKFLKVEIAPASSATYQLQGTSQLLSVPYALYSEKTRLIAGNNTINITNGNTITGNYQAANNTILVNGNTIAGNYQAGNNTVLVNGNTITGNYLPANNTILVTGNTIAGNYQAANNTVLVNGNTIAGNYQAGTGINITGNTITATGGNNLWVTDPNGIHNVSGKVGIGVNSHPLYPLDVYQPNSGVGNSVARFQSDDVWHAYIALKNNPANYQYGLVVGGPSNTELRPNNFAITNTNLATISKHSIVIDGLTNNIGLGFTNTIYPAGGARSTLHIFRGDVNISEIGSGIIIKSPNGQCWRITIDNAGNLIRTSIVCP